MKLQSNAKVSEWSMGLWMENWVPKREENSYLMALLYINVNNSSHAISGMSKTSNMKDHLNQGRFISYNQEIYLKFFNNGTVHANFSVQTTVQTCKRFIPFNMNSKNLEHVLPLFIEMHICSPDITCISDSTLVFPHPTLFYFLPLSFADASIDMPQWRGNFWSVLKYGVLWANGLEGKQQGGGGTLNHCLPVNLLWI